MAEITLKSVSKKYGQLQVVHGIDLDIADNEFVVLVGPSGCGKSTTLRMIAGLEEISDGTITIGSQIVNDLPPRKRNISMVFQNYALYPHMSVQENLGFSLKIAKMPANVVAERVAEAVEMLDLNGLMDRTPAELSGGQRQRVAMGRAIVRHPEAFLFDEPLSNLDAKLRVQMRTEIKKLHQRVEATVVYVTHDQVEAMTLADRIVVMKDGRIEQVGTPMDVFGFPANTFVAGFIGSPPMNLIDARIEDKRILLEDGQFLPVPQQFEDIVSDGTNVILGVRADDLTPVGHGISNLTGGNSLKFAVDIAEPLGAETLLYTHLGNKEILGKMFNPKAVSPGEVLDFNVSLDKIHLFDFETGSSLRRK